MTTNTHKFLSIAETVCDTAAFIGVAAPLLGLLYVAVATSLGV